MLYLILCLINFTLYAALLYNIVIQRCYITYKLWFITFQHVNKHVINVWHKVTYSSLICYILHYI